MSAPNRTPAPPPQDAARQGARSAEDFASIVKRVARREAERDPVSGLTPEDASSDARYCRTARARLEVRSPHFRLPPGARA